MIQAETLELLEWPRLCQQMSTFAATKLGVLAARSLPIPTTQSESLHLLAQTQEAYDLENRQPSALTFEGIHDIGESLERAGLQGLLSGDELLAIATTLAGVRRLRRAIDDQPDLPVLTAMVADLRTYPEIEQEIHRCIDDRGDVADRASPKLAGIRTQLRHLRDRIYQVLQGILQRQANAVSQQLITQRGDRFVIPVKATHKDVISGIVHDTSSSGATLFVEPNAIVQLGNQMRQHQRSEQVEEEAVRRALTEQVAAVKPDLEQVLAVATNLDLATAKARYSYWLEANPPRFIDTPSDELNSSSTQYSITLRRLRHPLLVWQHKHEQGHPVVPVDLSIQPQIRVVTITGPNTGGKTVTLKTLGLAALMAKVGLFVPAREPVELPWFDLVLADIGDEQSLEQSLSTFSGHIRRISRILNTISDTASEELGVKSDELEVENQESSSAQNSELKTQNPNHTALILLDEVGAGTDPAEGSALAISLLHYLADHSRLTIATTHFGELKALKYQDERFENASVEFDDVSLSPTYRLLWGIPGRSNALTIARRLGLKPEIVDEAQTQVGGDEQEINQVIAGLEAQRRSQETKAQEAAQLLKQAERLHEEVSRKAAALQAREQELKAKQEQAVQQAIAEAKGEIAQVIRRLQKGTPTAQDAQVATQAVNAIGERHLPLRQQQPKQPPAFKPKVGDRVRVPRLHLLGQTAVEVLQEPDDDGKLTVRFGQSGQMRVDLADIESLDGQKPEALAKKEARNQESVSKVKNQAPAPVKPAPAIRTSQNTVDIRGSRVADAEIELDRAIAQASPGPLWIIHGKGTGQLRRGVHAFLEQHPQVERYELADTSEGGSGVTIAYIQ